MENNFVRVGKWGGCLWGINKNGELFINEGEAGSIEGQASPWAESASQVITATAIGEITFPDGASVSGLFRGCKNMKKADLSGFVTDNVADMSSMFEGCANLKELDLSSFDTHRCRNMERMFSQCARLTDILMSQSFSIDGDGSTSCGRLAIKEYGRYKKGKTIAVEGFSVRYHSNRGDDNTEQRQTVPDNRYIIEEPLFAAPSDRAAFVTWNTQADGKGVSFSPGTAIESVDEDLDLYAVWAWAPEIKDVPQMRSFSYGEKIPFEIPEIVSINDPEVTGFLEISKTGEEGSWHAIDHNTILPVSFNGYLIRLHASNSVGETVSNAVRINMRKATIDTSTVRWAEEDSMVYDGHPKEVHLEGLPEGVEPRYEGNVATEAGTYVASFAFRFDQENFNEPIIIREHEWTIHKAVIDMSDVCWDYQGSFEYDGGVREIKLTGLPAGVTAAYENNRASDAGIYTATATLIYDRKNYELSTEILPCTWEIKRAVIDPAALIWSDCEKFVYDGTSKSVRILNLPPDASVEYDGENESLAGKYLARAQFIGNYCTSGPAEYEWEIAKRKYDMSGLAWTGDHFTYDDTKHRIELTGVPSELRVRYVGNEGITAGQYTARAIFLNPDTHNFVTPDDAVKQWSIAKFKVDMSEVRWDYEGPFTYDGEARMIRLTGLPDGIQADYENNAAYNAGEYNAHAILKYDTDNLEVEHPADCQWRINKKKIDVTDAYWAYSDAFTYDGREHGVYLAGLPEGLIVEYTDNFKVDTGVYVASATLTPTDTVNFEVPEINGCTWAIKKADCVLGAVTWTECRDFVYDGKEKRVKIASELDDSIKVTYEGNKAVNAGRYYAKALFSLKDGSNFNPPKPTGYSWSIAKAHHDMSRVVWDYENELIYDGSRKSVKLLNVPDGIIVKYRNNTATEAGVYVAAAHFEVQDISNYEAEIPDMVLEWSIRKAVFDMSKVSWQGDREYAYDGGEHGSSLHLAGLPDGLVPIYSDNSAVNAGQYTARASFDYDEANYERPEAAPCHWIIEKSPLDTSSVSWAYDKAFVYDGSEKRVAVNDVPEGSKIEYTNATAVQAGTYVAAAEIVPDDRDNRVRSRLENLTWRIERGEYDMSHAHWDYEKPFVYDGSERRVVIKGLPEGVTPQYRGNVATDAGNYKATVTFTVADEHNYNVPEMESIEWSIEKASYDMSLTVWNYDGEFTYTGRLYEVTLRGLPDGVRAVYSGNAAAETGSYRASAELIPFDPENYNKPEIKTCKWKIVKADFEMGAVRWDYGSAKIYNGRMQGVMLEHLPSGVSAEYEGNEAVNVGKYTASAKLTVSDPSNYNTPSVSDCDWEIIRASYNMSGAYWDYTDGKFIFDGKRKSVRMKNLPDGVSATYKGNTASFAGEYHATANFDTEDRNFEVPDSVSLDWSIEKAEYDMSGAVWNYTNSFTFDGSPKRIELTGLPAGISVEYSGNTAVDAGIYTAVASFRSETSDYNVPADMQCTWEIEKADIDIRRLVWNYSQSFVYDSFAKKVELEGVPDLLSVRYSGNTATAAGRYTAHADLIPVKPENYNTPVMRDCNWEIIKGDYDMSDARWDGDFAFTYDGSEKGVYIAGLPQGVTPVYYENTGTNAGVYTARVDLACDYDNYNVPVMGECRWTINKSVYDMSGAAWRIDDDTVYDGTVRSVSLTGLPEGVTPVYSGNEAIDAGDYEASVDFIYDEANYHRPEFGGCRWHISRADIDVDLSEVRWEYSGPFVYDGSEKGVSIAEVTEEQGFFDRLRGRKANVYLAGIPEGFDVIYKNNTATQAGVYYATATLVSRERNDNFNELVLPEFRWEILKAKIDLSNVVWSYERPFVYDGEAKTVELLGLPDTVMVTYTDNTGVDAGEHEAMASVEVKDPFNYETPKPVSGCWWQIEKATYDMSKVHWTYDDDIVYSGREKVVRLAGLPEGVKVESYRGHKAIEAGNYTAEAYIRYNNKENYEEPSVPVLKWKIRKRKIDTGDVVWNYDDTTLFVYDEKPKEVKLLGVPADVEVAYVDNSKINAGTYTARARLIYDTKNCELDDVPDLRWKIEKAKYNTSGVHWTYEKPFEYDGNEKSISLRGVPGSIAVRYRDNRASAMGTYTAKAYLTYDSDNYEAPEIDTTIDWAIVGRDE